MYSDRLFGFFAKTVFILILLASSFAVSVSAGDNKSGDKKKTPDYALIYGTVWTGQGRPAAGIPVKIRRVEDKKARWQLISNNLGEFAQRVPPGKQDYVVWADLKHKKGQKDEKPVETKVHIENDERQDIGLHLNE